MSADENMRTGNAEAAGAGPRLTGISVAGDGSVWGLDPDGALLGNTHDVVPWEARPAGARLVSVGAGGDGAVYAVDDDGNLYSYQDGWVRLGPLADGRLTSVSVGGASVIWGVDATGGLRRFDPAAGRWSPVPAPPGAVVTRVAASLDGSVFCLSGPGDVHALHGTDWVPLPGSEKFTAIGAAEAGWLWGATAGGGLAQYDGQGWQSVATPGGTTISRVACGADLTVWTLDTAGRLHQFDAAHEAWRVVGAPVALADIALGSAAAAWAVGADQEAYQYTLSADVWSVVGAPGNYSQIAAIDAGALWAVDAKAGVCLLTRSGTDWSVTPEPPGPVQLAAGRDGSVWGAGADGAVLGFDPARRQWQPLPSPPTKAVRVSAGDAMSVTALDASGGVYQYDPAAKTWTTLDRQAPADGFADIAPLAPGVVYAVAAAGEIYLYIGNWLRGGGQVTAISAGSASNIWAIDLEGHPAQVVRSLGEGMQGPGQGPPGWEAEDVFDELRSTHLWIVNRAIRKAAAEGGPTGKWLQKVLRPGEGRVNDPLHDNMCQGLYDADWDDTYNDAVCYTDLLSRVWCMPTWKSHFYDPESRTNYDGETSPTAMTQGSAYFTQSVDAYLREHIDTPEGAGYRLGLALHYLTDLTQPMHATNYTWLSSFWPGYHGAYEAYIMECQSAIQPQEFDIPRLGGSPGAYLEAAARHSAPYLPQIVPPAPWGFMTFPGYLTSEKEALIRASAPALLGYAIAAAAGFLLAWGEQTYRPREWRDMGQPDSEVRAVRGLGTTGDRGRPNIFVTGSDNNVWVRWYTGSGWQWSNLQGSGLRITAGIGSGTSSYGPALFTLDEAEQVCALWWDANQVNWTWANLGAPPAERIAGAAVAASPVGDAAVFALTVEGTLFKNQVPSPNWARIPRLPDGRTATAMVGATVLAETAQRCVMVIADDGQLYLWVEPDGRWVQGGAPAGFTVKEGLGVDQYAASVLGNDGAVWIVSWTPGGGPWLTWQSLGQPPGQTVVSGLTVNDAQYPFYKIVVMGRTADGPVVVGEAGPVGPSWDDHGQPGTTTVTSVAGFLPWLGDFLIPVVGADGHLWA